MNGKQLFCLSLILLSISMGLHWHKNRPKPKPKKPQQNRVALKIEDLQIVDKDKVDDPVDGEETSDQEQDPEATDQTGEEENTDDEGPETPDGESTNIVTASSTETLDELSSDPVIAAIRDLPRNPFEKSPYAELYEQLRAQQQEEPEEEEKKSVKLLSANFSATIGTAKELVAVIDSRLYRTGELFQNKKITAIKPELVALESGNELFLLPKVGVDIAIDEEGNYTVDDSFHKN